MALTDNLVSYYKLDEASGDATDSVSSYTGTNTNATFSAGKINNGANIGSTAKFVITDTAALKPTGSFSVAFWAKTTDSSGSAYRTAFQSYSQVSTVAGFEILKHPSNQQLWFVIGNNSGVTDNVNFQTVFSGSAINDGNWHHFVCVYNGSNINIYTDGTAGTAENWTNGAAYTATNYVRMGCNNLTGTDQDMWNGSMDEVGFWSRALSSAEVTALYNSGSGSQYPWAVTPVAAFSGNPLTGYPPLSVTFTDASTNTPTSWSWEKDNVVFSTDQNPVESFATLGTFDIKLTATNAGGSDDEEKLDYITVTPVPIVIKPMSGTKHKFTNTWKFKWKFKSF